MSKAHAKVAHHRAHERAAPARARVPDGAVYIGLLMIGVFGIWVWYAFSGEAEEAWRHGLLGYVIAVLGLVNVSAWRVYLGTRLPPWQQSLARLCLRFAGFGTRGGRPFEAAHGDGRVKAVLVVALLVSAAVIAGLAWLLYLRA